MSSSIKRSSKKTERAVKCRADGRLQGPDTSAYHDWTVFDLKLRVKELGIEGFSDKSRTQLIQMLQQG